MKPANNAPLFACLYSGVAEVARPHGYALAIHGSVATDMDLVAVPWTDAAVPAEELIGKLTESISASGYRDYLQRECGHHLKPDQIDKIAADADHGCTVKPHGRLAWNLYMLFGVKVDVSVMPRIVASR